MYILIIFCNGMFKIFQVSNKNAVSFNEDWVTIIDDMKNPIAHYPTVNNIQEISFHISSDAAQDAAAQYGTIG